MTPMNVIAQKMRRALRNETGIHFTLDELRALAERGALKLVSDAEIEELIASWNSPP